MTVKYRVIYTEEAEQDLINIYSYISLDLKVPVIARKQADRIMDFIKGLEKMPLRHKLYRDEPWHSRGLRVCPVDNYLIFYLVDEKEQTVAIIRIMYGKRNIELQLANEDNPAT